MNINTNNILNNLQMNLSQIAQPNRVDNSETADVINHDSINSDMNSTKANLMAYNDAIGYMQIADGVLDGISKQTEVLNKLDVAMHNDALNSDQKSMLKNQMQEIKKGITQTISNTTYNGMNVFNNSFKLGDENVSLEVKSDMLNINDSKSIHNFQKFIDNTRSDIGSFMVGANKKADELTAQFVNEANSKAQFEPDIAQNINNINKDKLQLNASNFAAAHNTDLLAQQIYNLLG
jgi:flagellin